MTATIKTLKMLWTRVDRKGVKTVSVWSRMKSIGFDAQDADHLPVRRAVDETLGLEGFGLVGALALLLPVAARNKVVDLAHGHASRVTRLICSPY